MNQQDRGKRGKERAMWEKDEPAGNQAKKEEKAVITVMHLQEVLI